VVEPPLPTPGKGFEGGVDGASPGGVSGEGGGEGEWAELEVGPEFFG
jgi:hypothetical protein